MTPVAQMVGSHRIVTGNGIVHPMGAADATPEDELALRRRLLERAAAALATPVQEPTILT
jgi:glycine reductase